MLTLTRSPDTLLDDLFPSSVMLMLTVRCKGLQGDAYDAGDKHPLIAESESQNM